MAWYNRDTTNLEATSKAHGKTIRNITLGDDQLVLTFDDGQLSLWDDGQDCCERRYMTCDDDFAPFKGATFMGWEVADGGERDGYEVHEVQFLRIMTSRGIFTCESHNEHNGYYGGFTITAKYTARETAAPQAKETPMPDFIYGVVTDNDHTTSVQWFETGQEALAYFNEFNHNEVTGMCIVQKMVISINFDPYSGKVLGYVFPSTNLR